jgi:hypothetical protein
MGGNLSKKFLLPTPSQDSKSETPVENLIPTEVLLLIMIYLTIEL